MHVVVHVGELQRVRERVDATRDKPYRQSTATRSARQPEPDTVLSSERVERGAHIHTYMHIYPSGAKNPLKF